jgi:predicted transposase YbfD/YdcC
MLRNYFPYANGIPSKSTICTTIGLISKSKFSSWFNKWAQSLSKILPAEIIAIDGKTIKGSKTKQDKACHILNAFAKKQGIIIGVRSIGAKTNEIPEIPKLLDDLDVKNSTITIDALGCQKEITAKIKEKEADYFIGLKGNQPKLYEDSKYLFSFRNKFKESDFFDYSSGKIKNKGRIEYRKCWSTSIPEWFKEQHKDWQKLNSINLIESERHIGDKQSIEHRYYISSHAANAKKALELSRSHWSVENNVHFVLDVTFREDNCQVKNAAENMSIIRKIIMNLIKKYKEQSGSTESVPSIRKQAAWCPNISQDILAELFT